ncbi:MAG: glycosyltransferase family 4 protein [Chthoniobacterales bacterium]
MNGLAYIFERFPSFSQTFCYREIVELERQKVTPPIFSIRRPVNEPAQTWNASTVNRVAYLQGDEELVREVDRGIRKGKLPEQVAREILGWGRRTDFLRLYQAAYLGPRFKALGIRHVHTHFAGMAARTAYWIGRLFGIGYSFTAHANDIFSPKPFEISLGELVQTSRGVVTVNDFGLRFLREKFPGQAAQVHRVYNGIEPEAFKPADFRATPPLIISVGRLIEKKGFADLIEACRLLREKKLEFRCEIIGEGPFKNALSEQIAAAGLAKDVTLAGPLPQSEVIERLAGSALFVLPCVAEAGGGMDNLPTVVMEAMAAGLPVISTPLAGVPEMVLNGETGFLVPEHEPFAVAEAIIRLLENPERSRALGKTGLLRAAEIFSLRKNVTALRTLFQTFTA